MKFSDLETDGLESRFWPKVAVSKSGECWLWQAVKNKDGYGRFRIRVKDGPRQKILAHRFAYLLAYGEIPDGVYVLHHCDVPACVNPRHLWLGSLSDNARDAFNKGRRVPPPYDKHRFFVPHITGEQHWQAKLTNSRVVEIRERRANGERGIDLARHYGVSQQTICDVYKNRTWSEIK